VPSGANVEIELEFMLPSVIGVPVPSALITVGRGAEGGAARILVHVAIAANNGRIACGAPLVAAANTHHNHRTSRGDYALPPQAPRLAKIPLE
jgi:hypothetical protein